MSARPDLTSPRVLREILAERGLVPHRQWGQNFLIDGNIAVKIVAALDLQQDDRVVEIGPGAGALTALLAGHGTSVLAVEIDKGLHALLQSIFDGLPNIQVVNSDALQINWVATLQGFRQDHGPVKLLSNLPYIISGPFMYNLFRERFPFNRAVLMFQREVAERLTAGPGSANYGALSVLCDYYCHRTILFDVSNKVFWPQPKVGSAVVMLEPREPLLDAPEEKLFFEMVQGLFRQRRKTVLNNLISYGQLDRDAAVCLLNEAGIEISSRPERLSAEQFALLARINYNYHK